MLDLFFFLFPYFSVGFLLVWQKLISLLLILLKVSHNWFLGLMLIMEEGRLLLFFYLSKWMLFSWDSYVVKFFWGAMCILLYFFYMLKLTFVVFWFYLSSWNFASMSLWYIYVFNLKDVLALVSYLIFFSGVIMMIV